jgi:acyl-CoA thioester hydrolase
VECDYLAALVYDDPLRIGVRVVRVGRTSFTVGFEVAKEEQICVRAQIVVVCVERGAMRPHPLPEGLRQALLESYKER